MRIEPDLEVFLQKKTNHKLLWDEKDFFLNLLRRGLNHEINNSLNYIQVGTAILKDYLKNDVGLDEQIPFLFKSIKAGTDRIEKVMHGVNQLPFSGIVNKEKIDIKQLIENCLLTFEESFKGKISVCKKNIKDRCEVYGNYSNLHFALVSILKNSEQSIINKGKIVIDTKKNWRSLIIEISDTGIGIDQDDLPKIIDPFFTTKVSGMGVGLGLPIAYNIIKAHQGKLSIESEKGKGTTVKITLPKKREKRIQPRDGIYFFQKKLYFL